MKKLTAWRTWVLFAAVVGLIAGVAALGPAAASARSVTKCANKSVKVRSGTQTSSVPVKAITTEGGVSCATAYQVIAASLEGARSVQGFSFRPGGFKAPEGLFPETASKGSKKIYFAIRAG